MSDVRYSAAMDNNEQDDFLTESEIIPLPRSKKAKHGGSMILCNNPTPSNISLHQQTENIE